MNWKNAFHPNAPISSGNLRHVIDEITSSGYEVGCDSQGRINSVIDGFGRNLLRDFFAPTDDVARLLPNRIVALFESESKYATDVFEGGQLLFA